MTRPSTGATVAVLVACGVGLLHAASSVYWALGGQWLRSTVGQGAMELVERSPVGAGALLGVIGLVKAVAAIVPVAVALGRVPRPRFWRAVSWVGGCVLVAYGTVHVVVSSAVLAGVIRPDGGYDADAMAGHAFLWGPLFLVWGAALIVWLRLSARTAGIERLSG